MRKSGLLSRHGTPQAQIVKAAARCYLQQCSRTNRIKPDNRTGVVGLNPAIYANSMGMLMESTLKGLTLRSFPHLPAIVGGG